MFLLAACAGACFLLGRDGVETDLLALVGRRGTVVEALAEKSSSQIRLLCENERAAHYMRRAWDFDELMSPTNAFELVRTHGKGLLSAKHRAQLEAGETNKIARSAMRRDYSGVGIFPKEDDPFYFLNDFAMDFSVLAPRLPDGAVLLTADVRGKEDYIYGLVLRANKIGGVALSGAPFHADQATRATKFQISILGGVSLFVVLMIGLWLFGSYRFVLPTFFALGTGFLAGSAAVLVLPGRPHVPTFLFGTTLIGLGVDYCYHAVSGEASRDRKSFVRSLAQALATTSLSFAPLVFSSVAVLREMSVFTIVGLAAIFGWAVLWGGKCCMAADRFPHGAPRRIRRFRMWVRVVLFALAAYGLTRISFGNDPSSFYDMGRRLAVYEARVAEVLGYSDAKLALVDFADFDRWQRENAALKAKMGVEPGGDFLSAADLPRQMRLTFKGREYLVFPSAAAKFLSPGLVRVIDTRGELASMFESLASETNVLLAVSFAVLLVVLVAFFRRRFFSYAAPIAASVVATAGVLGWFGMTVCFFHLVCFFILVGVGIDYVIFHRAGGSSRVVKASFLTSFIGFGTLALTSFPVTRGMGVTLACGLFFSYLFSLSSWGQSLEKRGQSPTSTSAGWADQPQRGAGKIRMWAIFTTYRILGKSFTKFVCIFIILCVYPWAKPVRDALRKFLEAARRRFPQSCEDFRLSEAARRRFPQSAGCTISPFRIMLNFAWAMVDKMDACCFMKSPPKMTVGGDTGWMKGGCFLLSTHVGCIEVLPALAGAANPGPQPAPLVHAFQQMGRDAIYTSYFVKHLDRSKLRLHAVEDIGVETAVGMQDAIRRGDIVLMAGDRPAASGSATLRREFLGCECEFPKGVFRFAKLMECPVYAITCVRTGWNAYAVEAKLLGADILGDYAAFLESAALAHPDQWYQFYDFFAGDGKLVDRP